MLLRNRMFSGSFHAFLNAELVVYPSSPHPRKKKERKGKNTKSQISRGMTRAKAALFIMNNSVWTNLHFIWFTLHLTLVVPLLKCSDTAEKRETLFAAWMKSVNTHIKATCASYPNLTPDLKNTIKCQLKLVIVFPFFLTKIIYLGRRSDFPQTKWNDFFPWSINLTG